MANLGQAALSALGSKISNFSGVTYRDITEWLNEIEKSLEDRSVKPTSRKYMASGLNTVFSGTINTNTNKITITTDSHDFKVGHGITIRTSDGAKQVETLKINTPATANGTITIKLDGATLQVNVSSGDTAIQIADKIRNVAKNGDGSPISQKLDGSGWSVDTNATGSTDTLTFTHSNQGVKTPMTFTGASGVTATPTVTTTGIDTTSFTSKITDIDGRSFTIRDTYTGTTVINKRLDHNDTEAVNAAIMDVFNKGGGIVDVKAGRYQMTELRLKSRVLVKGSGWGTRFSLIGNTNNDFVKLDTPNEEMIMIRDLCIDGGKLGQTQGVGLNIDNTGGSGFSFYDPVHILDNILIINTKGDGFSIAGTREAEVKRMYTYATDGNGYNITATDCFFQACSSANAGLHGWKLNTPNTRFSSCKAYGTGRIDSTSNGDGYFISGHRHNLANCEVQDAGRHGVHFYGGSNNIVEGMMADSNGNRYSGSSCGFIFANGAANNKLTGHALNRTGYVYQKYGLSVNSDCLGNVINIIAQRNNNIAGEIYPGQGAGNTIVINNQLGTQTPTFSASYTPEVYAGGTIILTLTGNITINSTAAGHFHTGAVMKFMLKQDATGGRTITFSSQYKTNFTTDTTANKTNIITFMFDGTNWIQQGALFAV